MEKIEGIDLNSIVGSVDQEILSEKQSVVRKQVRGIYNDIGKWQDEVKRAREAIQRAEQAIVKANEKLTRIKGGDWSVLQGAKASQSQPSPTAND